jgi:heme exporter protein A
MPAGLHIVGRGVARRYGRRWALAGVDLEVPPGGTLMLTGANGSGKSTLLRLLSTAVRPHAGRLLLDGVDVWEGRDAHRPQVGVLSHALLAWDDLSPRQNLEAWARLAGVRPEAARWLSRVGLDPARADPVRNLSAGMKRRLALARLLIRPQRLLLLDEPFSALDPAGRALLVDVVGELTAEGATLVVASHLPQFASALCRDALTLDAGHVVWRGPATALANTAFVG